MSDDPVVVALAEVASLVFPAVYAPDVQVGLQSLPNPVALGNPFEERHTAYARAAEAIGQDPTLSALMGDDAMYGTFITQDTGRGWALLKAQLPDVFVQTTASYVRAKQESIDTVQPLLEELGRVVDRVRRLISGEPDQAVVLTALHGIELADTHGCKQAPQHKLKPPKLSQTGLRPTSRDRVVGGALQPRVAGASPAQGSASRPLRQPRPAVATLHTTQARVTNTRARRRRAGY